MIVQNRDDNQQGFTLIELLVSIALFGIVSLAIASATLSSYRQLGKENRLAQAVESLRMSVYAMTSEIRMASHVSPYLPGTTKTVTNCAANLAVTTTTVKFLVVHEDSTNARGTKTYYVGYEYDSANNRLYRGEVVSSSNTSCSIPAGDPLAACTKELIAENVVQVDIDNDTVNEPIFSLSGSTLTISLGAQVQGDDLSSTVTHEYQTAVGVRTT